MWTCPKCGRKFTNRNQWHSCGKYSVKEFLKGRSKKEIHLYKKFTELVEKLRPVKVAPAKTRIGFQKRMIFAAVNGLNKDKLRGHIVLSERMKGDRFTKIERLSPRSYVHHFVISSVKELDRELLGY